MLTRPANVRFGRPHTFIPHRKGSPGPQGDPGPQGGTTGTNLSGASDPVAAPPDTSITWSYFNTTTFAVWFWPGGGSAWMPTSQLLFGTSDPVNGTPADTSVTYPYVNTTTSTLWYKPAGSSIWVQAT